MTNHTMNIVIRARIVFEIFGVSSASIMLGGGLNVRFAF
jgi:hypothetical protein